MSYKSIISDDKKVINIVNGKPEKMGLNF